MVKFIDDTGLARLWARIKTWAQGAFVPVTRKVNNKALSGDITLNAADVGAVIPTNVSAFTNDAKYVSSAAVTNVVYISQADYDALATKDANTLYLIPSET